MRQLALCLLPTLLLACGAAPESTEEPDRNPDAIIEQASTLFGMHDAPIGRPELAGVKDLMPNGGWLVNAVYSTDLDWLAGTAAAASQARQSGFTPVIRIDYARPDGSVFANGSPTNGATIPPEGDVGWCLARAPNGPSRSGGTHLACYLAAIDDLVSAASGVHTWIIGNEMNMSLEAKGFPGGKIPVSTYANVFRAARARIRQHAGHQQDAVFVGGLAPGAVGNGVYTSGRDYATSLFYALSPNDVDGIALHAYGGWPTPCDNGGVAALSAFENGTGGGLGYRTAAQWLDALGYSQKALLITEFSVHTHVTHGPPNPACGNIKDGYLYDRAATAQFIRDAYSSIRAWNWGPSNHAILGAAWFTWNDPASFAEESLKNIADEIAKSGLATPASDNPFAAMKSMASTHDYPGGDPNHFGECARSDGGTARTFKEVPYSLKGQLRAYWESTGGLPIFGFPIEDARCQADADSGRVLWMQYTQRARLEYHAELAGTNYEISLGLLGRPLASKSGVNPDDWKTKSAPHGSDCQWIGVNGSSSTGHYVCGAVYDYWKSHGVQDPSLDAVHRSIKLLGYPVSEEVSFKGRDGKTYTVQWFERARLERHPEQGGMILGGLLGCETVGDFKKPGCQ